MNPIVIPVSHSEVMWPNYLAVTKKLLLRNLSEAKDALGVHELAAFIASLEKLAGSNEPHILQIRKADWSLKFLHFVFLVVCDTPTLIDLHETGLSVRSAETEKSGIQVVVLAGDLGVWKQAILTRTITPYTRQLFYEIVKYFESLGLGQVFANYTKSMLGDGTIKLIPKGG